MIYRFAILSKFLLVGLFLDGINASAGTNCVQGTKDELKASQALVIMPAKDLKLRGGTHENVVFSISNATGVISKRPHPIEKAQIYCRNLEDFSEINGYLFNFFRRGNGYFGANFASYKICSDTLNRLQNGQDMIVGLTYFEKLETWYLKVTAVCPYIESEFQ